MITLLVILSLLISAPASTVQQSMTFQEAIGLDMSVPDFETNAIDAGVMRTNLAGILDMLSENYTQITYQRMLVVIAQKQYKVRENMQPVIKSLRFVRASKQKDEITIWVKIRPEIRNAGNKDFTLAFHFRDGVSESAAINNLFKYISHYAQMREKMAKQQ